MSESETLSMSESETLSIAKVHMLFNFERGPSKYAVIFQSSPLSKSATRQKNYLQFRTSTQQELIFALFSQPRP